MSDRIEALARNVDAQLAGRVRRVPALADELALEVEPAELLAVAQVLRDAPGLQFDTLIDVCGVDYLDYGRDEWQTNSATRRGFSRGVDRIAVHGRGQRRWPSSTPAPWR